MRTYKEIKDFELESRIQKYMTEIAKMEVDIILYPSRSEMKEYKDAIIVFKENIEILIKELKK